MIEPERIDFDVILGALGGRKPEQHSYYELAKQALVKQDLEDLRLAHSRASAALEGRLRHSSVGSIITGIMGLSAETRYDLSDISSKLISSPYIQQQLSMQGKSIDEALREAIADKLKDIPLEFTPEQVIGMSKRFGAYPKALAEYCERTGRAPEAVLKSPRENLDIIKQAFGSVEQYAQDQSNLVNAYAMLASLADVARMNAVLMMPLFIERKIKPKIPPVLAEAGLDAETLMGPLTRIAGDSAMFATAFIGEYAKILRDRTAAYVKLYRGDV